MKVSWRVILGAAVGGFLVLSAFAHSVLGTSAMRSEMAKAQVPEDLARSLVAGWYLGGMGQLVFGATVLWTFWQEHRRLQVSRMPALLVGLGYLGFTPLALVVTNFEPFFLVVFGLPGLLLTIASTPPSPPA